MSATMTLLSTVIELAQDSSDADFYDDAGRIIGSPAAGPKPENPGPRRLRPTAHGLHDLRRTRLHRRSHLAGDGQGPPRPGSLSMAGPMFIVDFEPHYGEMVDVSPLLRRMVCRNPSKFTFHGTGTYVIGRGDVAVVDPGPRDEQHVEALLQALDGERVRHILITHTHGDHSPAAAALSDATGAPVLGFGPPRHGPRRGEDHDDDTDDEGETSGETDETHEPQIEDDPEFQRKHAPDIDFDPETALAHGDIVDGLGTPSRRCTPGTSATTCASHCTRNTPCSPATM